MELCSEDYDKRLWEVNTFCVPELRDPLTIAITFMVNPGRFRQCCVFTCSCWDQAVYLEGGVSCPYITPIPRSAFPLSRHSTSSSVSSIGRSIPIAFQRLGDLPLLAEDEDAMSSDDNDDDDDDVGAGCESVDWYRRLWMRSSTSSRSRNLTRQSYGLHIDSISHLEVLTEGHLKRQIGSSVVALTVANMPKLSSIGPNFLFATSVPSIERHALREVCLTNLPQLTKIGDGAFGCNSETLDTVSLINLPALTKIGCGFCLNAQSIQQVHLEALPELREFGDGSFKGCSSLEAMEIRGLPNLQILGQRFLSGCDTLTRVDFENLPKLVSIGRNFLSRCHRLEVVELKGLSSLAQVGPQFLMGCPRLKNLLFHEEGEAQKDAVAVLEGGGETTPAVIVKQLWPTDLLRKGSNDSGFGLDLMALRQERREANQLYRAQELSRIQFLSESER